MKQLKFRKQLAEQILLGEKKVTWRLFDDKNISVGDTISFLIWETGEKFAKVEVISIKEIPFSELTEEDWKGHEKFSSEQEMFETYSKYYNRQIDKDTFLKIIKFKILE